MLLSVVGDLDIATRDDLVVEVRKSLDSGASSIVLNLAGVSFMDCAGLTGLLQARRLADVKHCQLSLTGASAPVVRLMRLTETYLALTVSATLTTEGATE